MSQRRYIQLLGENPKLNCLHQHLCSWCHPDEIVCSLQSLELKFANAMILHGVEFSIILLILAQTLQHTAYCDELRTAPIDHLSDDVPRRTYSFTLTDSYFGTDSFKNQRASSSFGAIVYRPINRLGSIMYEIVI